jgi:hypothetical protein
MTIADPAERARLAPDAARRSWDTHELSGGVSAVNAAARARLRNDDEPGSNGASARALPPGAHDPRSSSRAEVARDWIPSLSAAAGSRIAASGLRRGRRTSSRNEAGPPPAAARGPELTGPDSFVSLRRNPTFRRSHRCPMPLRPAMTSFRVRPRFEHTLELSPDEARARLLQYFAGQSPGFEVRAFPGFIGLHIGDRERRVWSPRLFLTLECTVEGRTRIQGTYGPEIEVWSVFLYGYMITGLLGTFAGVLAIAQTIIDAEPWALWVVGAMGFAATLLYLGAQFGQKLGAWQTFQLHQTYQAAIGGPTEIR